MIYYFGPMSGSLSFTVSVRRRAMQHEPQVVRNGETILVVCTGNILCIESAGRWDPELVFVGPTSLQKSPVELVLLCRRGTVIGLRRQIFAGDEGPDSSSKA